MANFVKFHCFLEDLGLQKHNLNTDEIRVFLTNDTPVPATHLSKGAGGGTELDGITEEHGYAPADVQNTYSQVAGVGSLEGVDIIWTATGGSFGYFQYAVLYNHTSAGKELIGYWEYPLAAPIICLIGEKFTVDLEPTIFTLI